MDESGSEKGRRKTHAMRLLRMVNQPLQFLLRDESFKPGVKRFLCLLDLHAIGAIPNHATGTREKLLHQLLLAAELHF